VIRHMRVGCVCVWGGGGRFMRDSDPAGVRVRIGPYGAQHLKNSISRKSSINNHEKKSPEKTKNGQSKFIFIISSKATYSEATLFSLAYASISARACASISSYRALTFFIRASSAAAYLNHKINTMIHMVRKKKVPRNDWYRHHHHHYNVLCIMHHGINQSEKNGEIKIGTGRASSKRSKRKLKVAHPSSVARFGARPLSRASDLR
jgi:hypothetical protein